MGEQTEFPLGKGFGRSKTEFQFAVFPQLQVRIEKSGLIQIFSDSNILQVLHAFFGTDDNGSIRGPGAVNCHGLFGLQYFYGKYLVCRRLVICHDFTVHDVQHFGITRNGRSTSYLDRITGSYIDSCCLCLQGHGDFGLFSHFCFLVVCISYHNFFQHSRIGRQRHIDLPIFIDEHSFRKKPDVRENQLVSLLGV